MPAQRTGGGIVKIHMLNPNQPELTACNLKSADVAYAIVDADVTCGNCKRILRLSATPDQE